jgi:hypothetical protein
MLAALEGHPHLETVKLHAWIGEGGEEEEEELCMRLAHMPALHSCSMVGMGRGGGHARLEVDLESLPALEVLNVDWCGIGDVAGQWAGAAVPRP